MTRKSYKALYLHQLQAAGENLDRAKRAERRLAEITKALAPYGREILETLTAPEPGNAIGLPPHQWEAARAAMDGERRFEGDLDFGWRCYSWKGWPLARLDP